MRQTLRNVTLLMSLVLMALATSCEKSETSSFAVPSESILVRMPGDSGTTNFDSSNIASIEVTSIPKGWVVNDINLYEGTITVTAPTSFDDEEMIDGDLTLTGYTPTGNTRKVTIFVAILQNNDVDFTQSPANCYIASKPKTRYLFNPYVGGSSTPLATESIEILWQTKRDLIKYLDLRDGKASFYLEMALNDDDEELNEVYAGNALIGARNAEGELIWSWHIWVTNSDPTTEVITLNGKPQRPFTCCDCHNCLFCSALLQPPYQPTPARVCLFIKMDHL